MTLKYSVTLLAAGLLIALPGFSQTAPTPPKESAPVELSPFEVSSESARGYVASETMSGSRVNL